MMPGLELAASRRSAVRWNATAESSTCTAFARNSSRSWCRDGRFPTPATLKGLFFRVNSLWVLSSVRVRETAESRCEILPVLATMPVLSRSADAPHADPIGRSGLTVVVMASESVETLAEELASLPDRELMEVLQRVLGHRTDRAAGFETRYFVGLATLEGFTETWEIAAVAHRDPGHYGDSLGPDCAISYQGECGGCGLQLYSHANYGLCPLCDSKVRLK